jgi:hypothetical protein
MCTIVRFVLPRKGDVHLFETFLLPSLQIFLIL